MNPEKHLLDNIPWGFFGTFSFKSLRIRRSVPIEMFHATMRVQAGAFRVHASRFLWALRFELGELTARPHFHALIAVPPASAVSVATCFSFMRTWEKLGGGNARVRVFDAALPGVAYVLDGVDEAYRVCGANLYELGKFGGNCDVTLSMSLIRHLRNRNRFGHRDHDGLFQRKLGYHARQRLKTGGQVEGDRHAGNTLQGPVAEFMTN